MGELEIIISCKYSEYRATVKVPDEDLKCLDMYQLGSFIKEDIEEMLEVENGEED